jgi:hypothetical protein
MLRPNTPMQALSSQSESINMRERHELWVRIHTLGLCLNAFLESTHSTFLTTHIASLEE